MRLFLSSIFIFLCLPLCADGPGDNVPEKVRPVPPPGADILEKDRSELRAGLGQLEDAIRAAQTGLKGRSNLLALLPDVEVFHKAVRYAVQYNEFFNATGEVAA